MGEAMQVRDHLMIESRKDGLTVFSCSCGFTVSETPGNPSSRVEAYGLAVEHLTAQLGPKFGDFLE